MPDTTEREQIVAWLRGQADTTGFRPEHAAHWHRELNLIHWLAARISRGDHLKESPHGD